MEIIFAFVVHMIDASTIIGRIQMFVVCLNKNEQDLLDLCMHESFYLHHKQCSYTLFSENFHSLTLNVSLIFLYPPKSNIMARTCL
jgi:hypothetical protein